MKIELGVLDDDSLMLVSDQPLRDVVRNIEYYKDQRLMMLIYSNPDIESELMHYEIPDKIAYYVEKAESVLIYSLYPDREPTGYEVPLAKIKAEAISA